MLLEKEGVLPLLENWTDADTRLSPKLDDLEFIYELARGLKAKVVLEFGIGYSTLVLATALEKNKEEWDGDTKPFKTNDNLFTVNVVEANNDGRWISGAMHNIRDRMPVDNIRVTSCPVMAGTFNDRICHYYTRIPNVLPDFIYLDAPDPMHVNGNIRGVHFNHSEALPMSGDLLFIEPILLPGTTIVVDGRTSNARFLQRNFQREWYHNRYADKDMTVFMLKEKGLKE